MSVRRKATWVSQDVRFCIEKALHFVEEGIQQIIENKLDEEHGVSVSPGATALATLSLLVLGRGYENSVRGGLNWLLHHESDQAWGKVPGGLPDPEITRIAQIVVQAGQGGLLNKLSLLEHAKQLSDLVLTLGHDVVPGLEGPTSEEIILPNVLEQKVLNKLPLYGRPVVVAAALLGAANDRQGVHEGIQYIRESQLPDGSWAEDIVATSLCIMALFRFRSYDPIIRRAGNYLMQKQYSSGGWPAFDQLKVWAVAWYLSIFENISSKNDDLQKRAKEWLIQAGNQDGSFGTTPSFTHPDLDDTAIALMALPLQDPRSDLIIKLLRSLQNENGSWGTFPSFKGVPPEIQSEQPVYIPSLDVTVHVLKALMKHGRNVQDPTVFNALRWLLSQQKKDGQFESVWFEGSIYGTAQVIDLLSRLKIGWNRLRLAWQVSFAHQKGACFLLQQANPEGGWGNSVAETALVISALKERAIDFEGDLFERAIQSIIARQNRIGSFLPAYHGIYAKGWNYEEPLSTALTVIQAFAGKR